MSEEEERRIFSKNLNFYLSKSGKTQTDLINDLGINKSTISTWCKGNKMPRMGKIQMLADYFGIEKSDLIEDKPYKPPMKGAIPVGSMANIPVLGRVSAGYGCLAEQEVLYYEPADIKYTTGEYFFLVVKGDSMAPQIIENDLVLIKAQNTLDSGDLGVVIIDNMDGVIKKVIYDNDTIHLISFNPYYPERLFKGSDISKIRIMGIVIESKRKW